MKNQEKKFPIYFRKFELPKEAGDNNYRVYRACKTHKLDKESFTPSFEENNFSYTPEEDEQDPSLYSLSVFQNPKDIKRFIKSRPTCPPCKIAVGYTNPSCGPSVLTSIYKPINPKTGKKNKSSHVDWWLYENAEPYLYFSLIDDFEMYMKNLKE